MIEEDVCEVCEETFPYCQCWDDDEDDGLYDTREEWELDNE